MIYSLANKIIPARQIQLQKKLVQSAFRLGQHECIDVRGPWACRKPPDTADPGTKWIWTVWAMYARIFFSLVNTVNVFFSYDFLNNVFLSLADSM